MKPNIAESIERLRKECAKSGWHAEIQKSDALALCNEVERQAEEIKRLREALIRERDDAMIWDGIGTVNRINIVLESGEALRRDTQHED